MDKRSGCDIDAVISAYVAAARRLDPGALAGPTLRVRSLAVRDVFTEAAAGRPLRFSDMRETLDASGAPPAGMLRTKSGRRWTAALARVMAASPFDEGDSRRAVMLYDVLVHAGGANELDADHQAIYAQLLFLTGALDRCAELLPSLHQLSPVAAHYLRCDLANPFMQSSAGSKRWQHLLNQPFQMAGLEPVEVVAGEQAPFDQLMCEPTARAQAGTRVSVIMTAFQPDASLLTSVRSIARQSWDDLEIVVVDDASGPGYEGWFEQCVELDSRVRVLRQEINGGTYVARNVGLDAATGTFVTFQDSDDWSHPRRIQRQVTPLLSDSATFATRSLAVRARSDLVHQWLGYPAQRVNASSLMLRRAAVMDRIGYFDSIRQGADVEYAHRLEAAFGRKVVDIAEPLAYTRLQAGSLSRSDFALGWAAPARIAHQAAYQHWHRIVSAGGPGRVSRTAADHPFPSPAKLLERVPGAPVPRRHFDVVLMDDWQPRRGPFDMACDEIAALTEAGLAVGVAHVEAPGAMTGPRRHPVPQIQQLVNDRVVDRVLLDDAVTASLLIVRDPIVLQFPPSEPLRLRADRVIVVVSRTPKEYPALTCAFDPATVTETVRDMFSLEPERAATDESFRADVGAIHVLPSPVDPRRWSVSTARAAPSRRPVVGAYDSDISSSEFVRSILTGGSVAARGTRRIRRTLRRLASLAARQVVKYELRDDRSWHDYLPTLDFVTCFPSREERIAPIEVVVRALAAGVVVIAPDRFGDVFGDAVVYSRRGDALRTIRRFLDPGRYHAQAERGRSFVRNSRPPQRYVDKIKSMITEPPVSDQ